MKYNDSFSLLFICAFITNVLHRMLSMSSYNNTFFILLVCLVTLLSLITTAVIYLKTPKMILICPVFLFLYLFLICDMLIGESYRYRDFLGFATVVAAIITLINVIKKKHKRSGNTGDGSVC